MAKFDSMHFDNSKGHALASLTSAEKYLEDSDLEGARIAFNVARPYIKIMETEANNEGAPKSKDGEWKELQNRLASLCDKYHEMKEAAENEEDETTENEEVEEEKNVDASVKKLIIALRNTLNIVDAISSEFDLDLDRSVFEVESMEYACAALLLIKELEDALCGGGLFSIRYKLFNAKKDAEIVAKVEAVKEAFDFDKREEIASKSIEQLREFRDICYKGNNNTVYLSSSSIFAAIHQTSDDVEIVDEEVIESQAFLAGKNGIISSFTYNVEEDRENYIGLILLLGLYHIARITAKGHGDEVFRKMSALGCEYALAFKNIAKNI